MTTSAPSDLTKNMTKTLVSIQLFESLNDKFSFVWPYQKYNIQLKLNNFSTSPASLLSHFVETGAWSVNPHLPAYFNNFDGFQRLVYLNFIFEFFLRFVRVAHLLWILDTLGNYICEYICMICVDALFDTLHVRVVHMWFITFITYMWKHFSPWNVKALYDTQLYTHFSWIWHKTNK